MTEHFVKRAAAFGGMGEGQASRKEQDEQSQEKHGVSVKNGTYVHEPPGNPSHFRAQLDEYLVEDRHDLHEKDNDHSDHHACHDGGIGNRAADAVHDGVLPGIVVAQGLHHLVQRAGFLGDLHHLQQIGREQVRACQRRIKAAGLILFFQNLL